KPATTGSSPVRRRREVRAIFPVRSELIVLPAFLGVAEDFVCFLDFLELLFGLLVVGIQVRMVLAGKFPVRLLDFVVLGGSRNAQDFVVIAKLHGHVCESTTD